LSRGICAPLMLMSIRHSLSCSTPRCSVFLEVESPLEARKVSRLLMPLPREAVVHNNYQSSRCSTHFLLCSVPYYSLPHKELVRVVLVCVRVVSVKERKTVTQFQKCMFLIVEKSATCELQDQPAHAQAKDAVITRKCVIGALASLLPREEEWQILIVDTRRPERQKAAGFSARTFNLGDAKFGYIKQQKQRSDAAKSCESDASILSTASLLIL
jgi:hypothetical protein